MSVLECDRRGCPNIMCDTLIDGSHYLCDECLAEFKSKCGTDQRSYAEFRELLEAFLDIEKRRGSGTVGCVDEFIRDASGTH